MKTRLTTALAVALIFAAGMLAESRPKAATTDSPDHAPALSPRAAVPTAWTPPATTWNFEKNRGRITRIYPEPTGVYFTFGGKPGEWQTAMNPANGYYFIPLAHPNYKSLVDLLYLAAEHDWNLQARTQPALGTAGRAEVIYLVQDFARP